LSSVRQQTALRGNAVAAAVDDSENIIASDDTQANMFNK